MNRNKEACHCRNVTYGMIEDAIKNGAETLQEVQDATGAGKGCGKCKEFLNYLIRDIKEEMNNRQAVITRFTEESEYKKKQRSLARTNMDWFNIFGLIFLSVIMILNKEQ